LLCWVGENTCPSLFSLKKRTNHEFSAHVFRAVK
jgi:hypothetical protein